MALVLTDEYTIGDFAGAGANTTIKQSSSLLIRYGERRELDLCKKCKKDFIGQYANLNDNIKGTLKITAAAGAALDIAGHDSRGYALGEHQTVLDKNLDTWTEGIRTLSEGGANTQATTSL